MADSTQVVLQKTLSAVWDRETAFGAACEAEGETEHAYKVAKARAFLKADGTEKHREATSVVESEQEFLKYLKAKATKDFCAAKLRDAQSALSARQSILSYEARSNSGYAQTGT